MSFPEYLARNYDDLLLLARDHLLMVVVSILLGTLVGLALGVLSYRDPRRRSVVLGVTGTILTIPSLALYTLLVAAGLGLGAKPVVLALTLYSLLPIVRNTITGLLGVDPAIVESAQGMGMGRWQRLLRIELPLAWPVILTGIRVSAMVLVGITALGAIVNGPGFGELIFDGLRRIGSPVAVNLALAGTLGVVLLGASVDALFIGLTRMTTPRGIRG
ncbi:MAG: ABC transporter permease [Euzebyales bacterium]|nr:ABC transporter permease [Euzebyales bacterium]